MIVRIMGEGQFDISDVERDKLHKLDEKLGAAVEKGDEGAFRAALSTLLHEIRSDGTPIEAGALQPSELILPREDATIDEVRKMLADEGLIPG